MNIDSATISSIYGRKQFPYYIYAPRWVDSSAGIRALHYLCHSLNMKGQKAYLIFTEPSFKGMSRMNPNLFTPELTWDVLKSHQEQGIEGILIYTETIAGNPLRGGNVIRYLMNYSGLLGGPNHFDSDECLVYFSESIRENYLSKGYRNTFTFTLFLPPVDPRDFTFNLEKLEYQLVYAGKYRSYIGEPEQVGNLPSIEIYREGPLMQRRSQVIRLLERARVLYVFENTSIVTEAILSGTPVVWMPNDFLGEIIGKSELGMQGTIFKGEDLQVAQESLLDGKSNYYKQIEMFWINLDEFVRKSQDWASERPFLGEILLPKHKFLINKHRIRLSIAIIDTLGIRAFLRVLKHFIRRRIQWRYWSK